MKETSWGSMADWYNDLLEVNEDTYQKEVILPNLLRRMEPQKGDDILDIACGQGFFSRALAASGAYVHGIDISTELISIANKSPVENVSYEVSRADKLSFAEEASYNKALIVLAIQNIENITGTFEEAYRILRPGGSLHIVLNHPAFRIARNADWGWDEHKGKRYRRIDRYMSEISEKIDMNPGEKNPKKKKTTVSFHRPLQVYFKSINKAGFVINGLEEWISHKKSQKGPRSAEEDRMRKEIPIFMYLEAKKI